MSNKKNKEIEIQVQVENIKGLNKFLREKAKFINKEHQVDKYFSPKDKEFLKVRPVVEWLRLRDSSDKQSINYKKWHHDKNWRSNYCDEYETHIENMDQVEKIFKSLEIKPIVTVDKTRKIYKYKDYEISIDSIKGLGNFVEIEYKGKNTTKSPAEITEGMIKFLKDLNCGKISRNYVDYPFQMLFPKEVEYEIF